MAFRLACILYHLTMTGINGSEIYFEPVRDVGSVFNSVRSTDKERSTTLMSWYGQETTSIDPNAEMATDRPDVTEASSTVGAGVLQIEAGYTYLQDRNGVTVNRSHSFPETLFRYGHQSIGWNYDLPQMFLIKRRRPILSRIGRPLFWGKTGTDFAGQC